MRFDQRTIIGSVWHFWLNEVLDIKRQQLNYQKELFQMKQTPEPIRRSH